MPRRAAPAEPPRTLLVILRHGDAGDALALPERDALRPLTAKGRKQSRKAGKALRKHGLAPRDVWTSRLRRSVETAEEAAKACGCKSARLTATAALSPDAVPERIAKALFETPAPPPPEPVEPASARGGAARLAAARRRRGRLAALAAGPIVRWVVGHEPHLSRLVGHLVGAPAAAFDLKKGAFAVVECDGRGPVAAACRLAALVSPDTLRAVRRS